MISGEFASLGKMGMRITSRLRIITNMKNTFIHPGEILDEEFLKPLALTQYKLANDIAVPRRRINEIVHGERAVSVDTALRLARYFGTSPEFWLNLQSRYDLLEQGSRLGKKIHKEVKQLAIA